MPTIKRGRGRTSKEKMQLVEALSSGKVNIIENVSKEKYYNLQQRIRLAGKDCEPPLKVSVYKVDKDSETLDVYFEGFIERKRNELL